MPNLLLARSKQRARDPFNGTALQQQWTKTDTENKLVVSGGAVAFAPKTVPAWDDPRLTWTKPLQQRPGLCVEWALTFTSFGAAGNGCTFGLDTTTPVAAYVRPGFAVVAITGVLQVAPHSLGSNVATPITLALNTEYRFRVLYQSFGTAYLVSLDQGKTWVPVWVEQTAIGVTAAYAGFSNWACSGTILSMRAFKTQPIVPTLSDTFAARTSPGSADTGQPWLNVPPRPTPTIAGDLRIPAGQTEAWLQAWDGIADGVWEADVNFGSAPSTQKRMYLGLRWQSPTNYVVAAFNRQAQTITVLRTVAGTQTTLGTLAAAGFTDATAYTFRVVAVGTTIKVYQGGVERLSVIDPVHQYAGLCSFYLNDTLATPDIRLDNIKVWGAPTRPLLMDGFDEPDASGIAPLPADSGQVYTSVPTWGYLAGRIGISNALAQPDPLAVTPIAQASYMASIGHYAKNDAAARAGGLVLRYQDAQNYSVARITSQPSPLVSIIKNVAGVRTTVSSSASFSAPILQDHLLSVLLVGNAIELYANGVRYVTATLSDFPTSPASGPVAASNIVSLDLNDLRVYPLEAGALVHDTFTRADSAATLGATELPGVAWVPRAASTWGISANQAYPAVAASGMVITVPALARDVDVQCDLIHQTNVIGLLARLGNNGADYLLVQFDSTNCKVRERVANGAVTDLSTTAYAWPGSGTPRTVRLRVFQSVCSAYVNGVLVVATPFAGHAGATEMEYGLYNSDAALTTNRFDNFSVKAVT